ncbi:MAG: lysophospholipid acyltransferase family protein [bacterium]
MFLTRTYLFYRIIKLFIRYFPMKFNYAAANILSDIFYIFPTDIKKNVCYNLSKIYELKREKAEIKEKGRQVFCNFGRYLIDLVSLDTLQKEEINKLFLEIDGIEYLDAVKNRGAIFVTLHMGNWELGGAFLTHRGYSFTAIYERHEDRKVSEFFNNIRLKHKFGIIDRRDIRGIISAIKDKKNIAILGDFSYDSQTIPVNFLGESYNFPAGAAVLALKFDIPIIPLVCVKNVSGHKILVSPLMEIERTGHLQEDIRLNARKLAKVLEGFVLKFPEQWFVFKKIGSE